MWGQGSPIERSCRIGKKGAKGEQQWPVTKTFGCSQGEIPWPDTDLLIRFRSMIKLEYMKLMTPGFEGKRLIVFKIFNVKVATDIYLMRYNCMCRKVMWQG